MNAVGAFVLTRFPEYVLALALVLGAVAVIAGPTIEPARVIAEHKAPPDSLAILRNGDVVAWAGKPWGKAGPVTRHTIPHRSFTKFGPGLLAWNVDRSGVFFLAWEDPEAFDLVVGDYQFEVVFWSPEPDTMDAGTYHVTARAGRWME